VNEDRAAGLSGPARRRAFVAFATAGAAGFALVGFLKGYPSLIYDAYHYFVLSHGISVDGIWNFHDRVRTYGYPLFVSLSAGLSPRSPEATRALVFAVQLAIYLPTCLYAARVAERVFDSPRFFYGTYLATAWNPIVLIRTTEVLTDLLSAVLILMCVLVSLERRRPLGRAFLAFFAAGLSIAVRPANIAILPALALAWVFRAWLYGEQAKRAVLAAVAGVSIALLPQLYSNAKAWGKWTPLPVEHLYGSQAAWGMSMLKYATLVVPGMEPQLVYRNPFYPAGVSRPGDFLARRPIGYLKTLGAHAFALFDHDFGFTYITDLKPWYRWPLSLLNYAFLFLAVFGLAIGPFRRREPEAQLYFAAAVLVSLCYVAIYLPVAVESRFSTPLYLILAPAAVFSLDWLVGRRSGTIVAVAIAGGGFLAACVQVSLWLSAQAPALSSLNQR
jgi:hypothetical protein